MLSYYTDFSFTSFTPYLYSSIGFTVLFPSVAHRSQWLGFVFLTSTHAFAQWVWVFYFFQFPGKAVSPQSGWCSYKNKKRASAKEERSIYFCVFYQPCIGWLNILFVCFSDIEIVNIWVVRYWKHNSCLVLVLFILALSPVCSGWTLFYIIII